MVKCQMKRSFSRGCENILSDLSFTIDFIYWSSLLCPIDFVILEYSFTIIKYKSSSNLQRLLALMSSYNSFFRAMPPKPWETRSSTHPFTQNLLQPMSPRLSSPTGWLKQSQPNNCQQDQLSLQKWKNQHQLLVLLLVLLHLLTRLSGLGTGLADSEGSEEGCMGALEVWAWVWGCMEWWAIRTLPVLSPNPSTLSNPLVISLACWDRSAKPCKATLTAFTASTNPSKVPHP